MTRAVRAIAASAVALLLPGCIAAVGPLVAEREQPQRSAPVVASSAPVARGAAALSPTPAPAGRLVLLPAATSLPPPGGAVPAAAEAAKPWRDLTRYVAQQMIAGAPRSALPGASGCAAGGTPTVILEAASAVGRAAADTREALGAMGVAVSDTAGASGGRAPARCVIAVASSRASDFAGAVADSSAGRFLLPPAAPRQSRADGLQAIVDGLAAEPHTDATDR